MKLTLLGTGTPIPDPARRGPAQCIEVGGALLLVDCGSGVLHRLLEAGYARPPIRQIALTHLHSDHITGLPDLLWAGWIMEWWSTPPPIVGPPGTAAFVEGLVTAFAEDIRVRQAGDCFGRAWVTPRVIEMADTWRGEGDGWQLTGFRVAHEPVDQAFGFRIDADGGALVVSGDTRPSENLIRHAHGADLLVHEVYYAAGARALLAGLTDPDAIVRRRTVDAYHTSSEELGPLAAQTEAHTLVLSHILFRGATPAQLAADITPAYRGTVVVGSDLQTFEVGRAAPRI